MRKPRKKTIAVSSPRAAYSEKNSTRDWRAMGGSKCALDEWMMEELAAAAARNFPAAATKWGHMRAPGTIRVVYEGVILSNDDREGRGGRGRSRHHWPSLRFSTAASGDSRCGAGSVGFARRDDRHC